MRKSVSTIIYEYLREHEGEWHAGFEFCNRPITIKSGTYFLGNSADRKARLMAERGVIGRTYKVLNGTRYAYYQVKPKSVPSGQVVLQKTLEMLI